MSQQTVREVMTRNPVCLSSDSLIPEAARVMSSKDIGAVLVTNKDELCGIVTDRDIVVRAVAAGKDVEHTTLGDICSKELETVSPDDRMEKVIELMRNAAVRRIPVIEGGKPVGILSLGDVSLQKNAEPALEDISAAPPNN